MADMVMVGCVRPGSTCDSRQKVSCSVSATACRLACAPGAQGVTDMLREVASLPGLSSWYSADGFDRSARKMQLRNCPC